MTALPAFTDMMNQIATYWAPSGNDSFGGVTYAAPIIIMCRWQSKETLVRSQEGQEVTSDTTVYVDRPLLVKGYIALDDQTEQSDPRTTNARQIISPDASPSLAADEQLYSVML